ncbi:MAG: TIGR00730 family Rossman fold protein [Clostridia bacterium]|nr:TIGR00730 family Rossman fold protein [Clostridia bacterium]
MHICVYGAANDTIKPAYLDSAYRLGQTIADAGHTMVFGGGCTGVMGAAAKGVLAREGRLVGIAPAFFHTPGILEENCTELILTETMRERKDLLEQKSDMFVAAPGGIGTLDEFFEIFTLRTLERHKKPIILLNTDGCWDALIRLLDDFVDGGLMRAEYRDLLMVISEPEELAEIWKEMEK